MNFESTRSILFSDTLVSDIFVTEYMASADGDYVKIYLYCLFLGKYKKQISINDLSKKLGIEISKVKQGVAYWENVGVFIKKENSIVLCDLKEKEVHKLYKPKLSLTPEEAKKSTEKNVQRNQFITAINNMFFQGTMSPTWYMDIETWFKKYSFEEDVMFSLFKYCYDRHALNRSYLLTVAENWYSKGIKNSIDLDNYYIEYERSNEIKKKICKKLSISRRLTEYEEAYIDKWVIDYKFDFNIIEQALKRTTSKTNPNFDYINAILKGWNEKSLTTVEEVQNEMKQFRQTKKDKTPESNVSNKFFTKNKKKDFSKFYDNLNTSS